ncbi:MAG: alanine racemase [Ruminococcus sp.]|nr:alanine racemase [Ruminococcus sp.]
MHYLKRTWAEISLDNLRLNVENYKKYLGEKTQLLCVVKANCYGHCDDAVVPYLENELGIKWFAVSNVCEAIKLRQDGIKGEILILGYTPFDEAEKLSDYNIIQACTEYDYAVKLSQHSNGKTIRLHVAIDTGMTRIGLRGKVCDICDDIERISSLDNIKVEGIFTHFAVADSNEPDDDKYTKDQSEMIIAVDDELKKRGISLDQCHFLNSAGGVYHYSDKSSLARLGIILYGLMPNPAKALPFKPEPVMSLKSCVSQVKTVEKDVSVSYGRTYKTSDTTKLATITCGYADGYPRALSNVGDVIINGKRAKITGRVCMDQFMCDVTDIDDVKVGDVVTLIGSDGKETITADDIADMTGTIGYEVVCGISQRVPRVIIKDGREIAVFG